MNSKKHLIPLFTLGFLLFSAQLALALEGFAIGPRFTLDTRPFSTEPGFALGPIFELSTLQIAGQVLTTAGAPLEGAMVSTDGFQAVVGTDGAFSLMGVKPGQRYTVTAFASGYGAGRQSAVAVMAGQSVTDLAFRLSTVEADYRVVPLWPAVDIVSLIMQGGTAVRYFQVQDEAGQPGPPGVAVTTDLSDDPFYSDAAGVVAVRVPWSQVGNGGVNERNTVQVTGVGENTLSTPLNFTVEVQARTYAMQWYNDGYSRVGISFVNVEEGGGTSIRLEETDGDLGAFNRLEVGREVRSGVGVEASVGASAGVQMAQVQGAKVGVGASARAGVEGMLSTVSADRYQFSYPDRTATQAMAQYVLIADGMVGHLSPHLVNLLAFVESRLVGESALDHAYVYGGRGLDLMVGARAEADATAGVFGQQVRAGIGVEAGVGAQGHGVLTWAEYPQEEEGSVLVGVTGQGRAGTKAEAGVVVGSKESALGAAVFAGLEGTGQLGGSIEVFFASGQVERVEIQSVKQGHWGFDIGAEFLLGGATGKGELKGKKVEMVTTVSIEGGGTVLREVLNSNPFGRALAERQVGDLHIGGDLFGRLLASMSAAIDRLQDEGQVSVNYTKEIRRIASEGGGEIELEGQAGVSALRVGLAAGQTIERQKVVVVERGAWVAGALRPLETYANDAFTPDAERTMAHLVQEIHDGMGQVVQEAFTSVVQEVQKGAETIVETDRSVLTLAADTIGETVSNIGMMSWSFWGPSAAAKAALLPATEYAVRAKIAATAQAAAQLDYGIGGFYQLTPPGEILSAPAALTLAYVDEDVMGLDEAALAVYTYDEETGEWLLVGGVVDAENNTVTADISVLGVYTLAPRIPSGEFDLDLDMGSLPADGTSTATALSDTIWNNDGTPVSDGTLFDVWATTGSILSDDEDQSRDGIQIAAQDGTLSFSFEAGIVALTTEMVARSVVGQAVGRATLELTDAVAPEIPVGLSALWDGDIVTLQWKAPAAVDLAGYRIYYSEGAPGPPYEGIAAPPGQPSPIVAGTDTTAQVLGLDPEKIYYFALSAYDVLGNESGLSGEVITQVGPTPTDLVGDFDGNGAVDFTDFFLFVDFFGKAEADAGFDARFDLDQNRNIGFGDFFLFVDHFGQKAQGKLLALAEQYLGLPVQPTLAQNYPNPFNASTLIRYTVPQEGRVDVQVYDVLGQPVRRLVSGKGSPGLHSVYWDGRNDLGQPVASGVYLYVLQIGTFRKEQRMLLLR